MCSTHNFNYHPRFLLCTLQINFPLERNMSPLMPLAMTPYCSIHPLTLDIMLSASLYNCIHSAPLAISLPAPSTSSYASQIESMVKERGYVSCGGRRKGWGHPPAIVALEEHLEVYDTDIL